MMKTGNLKNHNSLGKIKYEALLGYDANSQSPKDCERNLFSQNFFSKIHERTSWHNMNR